MILPFFVKPLYIFFSFFKMSLILCYKLYIHKQLQNDVVLSFLLCPKRRRFGC
jgi:hypothetical protein